MEIIKLYQETNRNLQSWRGEEVRKTEKHIAVVKLQYLLYNASFIFLYFIVLALLDKPNSLRLLNVINSHKLVIVKQICKLIDWLKLDTKTVEYQTQ